MVEGQGLAVELGGQQGVVVVGLVVVEGDDPVGAVRLERLDRGGRARRGAGHGQQVADTHAAPARRVAPPLDAGDGQRGLVGGAGRELLER